MLRHRRAPGILESTSAIDSTYVHRTAVRSSSGVCRAADETLLDEAIRS